MRFTIRSSADDAVSSIEAWAESIDDWSLPTQRPASGGGFSWDGRSAWDRIEDVWIESREELFDSYGVSEGTPWPRYADTEEAKVYRHAKAAILEIPISEIERDRLRWGGPNRLMRSMTGGSSEYWYRHSIDWMEVGTAVPYAVNHDQGIGVGPWWGGDAPIPRRPLLSMGEATLGRVEEVIIDYASERLSDLAGELTSFSGREALALMGGS